MRRKASAPGTDECVAAGESGAGKIRTGKDGSGGKGGCEYGNRAK